MDLFYVSDAAIFEACVGGSDDPDRVFFSCDTEVCFILGSQSREFINGWDLLNETDIRENWSLAHALAGSWLGDADEFNEIFGFNPLGCASQDLVYPIQAALNARTIFQRLVLTRSFNRFAGFANTEVPVLRTGPSPAHVAVNSVAEAVFLFLCEKNGIETALIRRDARQLKRPSFLARLASLPTEAFCFGRSKYDHLSIVFRDGMSYGEYFNLASFINAEDGWRCLAVTRGTFLETVDGGEAYEKIRTIVEVAEAKWKVRQSAICSDFPEIFSNPYLNFQFSKVKDELTAAILAAVKFEEILRISRAEHVFFGHDAFTFEKMLCNVANRLGVLTTGLIHGGAGYKFGYRGLVGDSRRVLVWNSIDYHSLVHYGVRPDRIRYCAPFRGGSKEILADGDHRPRRRFGRPLISILTTAVNCGLAAPVADVSGHIVAIHELCKIIEKYPEFDFTIRAHPNYDYYLIYEWIYKRGYPNLVRIRDEPTSEVIGRSTLCLMLNYYSSAAMECFRRNVPVIYYNKSVYLIEDWVPCYESLNERVSAAEDFAGLCRTIDRIFCDTVFRDRCVADGRRIVDELFPKFARHKVIFETPGATPHDTVSGVCNVPPVFGPFLYELRLLGSDWCVGALRRSSEVVPQVDRGADKGKRFGTARTRANITGRMQSNHLWWTTVILAATVALVCRRGTAGGVALRGAALEYLLLRFGSALRRVFIRTVGNPS